MYNSLSTMNDFWTYFSNIPWNWMYCPHMLYFINVRRNQLIMMIVVWFIYNFPLLQFNVIYDVQFWWTLVKSCKMKDDFGLWSCFIITRHLNYCFLKNVSFVIFLQMTHVGTFKNVFTEISFWNSCLRTFVVLW